MRATRSLAAAAVAGLATTVHAAESTTCYSGVNVFAARGTGEQPPTGLGLSGVHISAILSAIPGSTATVIDYPATYGNTSVPTGVRNGGAQIAAYLDACPSSKIVVMGYSQGAYVMGSVLTGIDLTITPEGTASAYSVAPLAEKYTDQITAVVFFGDPQYNPSIGINSDNPYPCTAPSHSPRNESTFGQYASRLQEWCNADDYVCCSTGTSFLGHISYFSEANGTITGEFVAKKFLEQQQSSGSSGPSTATASDDCSTTTATIPAIPATITPGRPYSDLPPHPSTARSVPFYTPVSKPSSASRISRPSGYSYTYSHHSASRYSSASGSGTVRLPPPPTNTPAAPTPVASTTPGLSSGSAGRGAELNSLAAVVVGLVAMVL